MQSIPAFITDADFFSLASPSPEARKSLQRIYPGRDLNTYATRVAADFESCSRSPRLAEQAPFHGTQSRVLGKFDARDCVRLSFIPGFITDGGAR